MTSLGIDNALARLRLELEGMQRQDKAIFSQLLTLREGIQGLKIELIREREEYEEAFRNLEEISEKTVEDDEVFFEQAKTDPLEARKVWKHDRQDSGISVKTPEAETVDFHLATKHDLINKPGIIPQSKQPLSPHVSPHVQTTFVTSGDMKMSKLIRHGKQDSGILIDEEAVRNTKLLSKLVESSEMFRKIETQKFGQLDRSHWQQVREQPQVKHGRSRSSTDLLLNQKRSSTDFSFNQKPERSLRLQLSIPNLPVKHSHTNSCPQTSFQKVVGKQRQLSSQDKSSDEERSSVENFNAKDCARQTSFKSATNDCPVTTELTTKLYSNPVRINQEKAPEKELQASKPMRAVVISAGEVNISNTTERRTNTTLSRRCSLDERGPGQHKSNDVTPQRRFTITNFENDRMRQLNGEPRFLSPPVFHHHQRNHLRHMTKPEYDDMKRRHTEHAPSKSWDGYARKPMEMKGIVRSVSQASFV